MLEALRSFVGGWVAKILLILLVGSFALWGVSGSILGGGDTNTVAQVGETKVSVSEFLAAYTRNMNQIQQQAGRRLTREEGRVLGVEARTLSNVVSFAALDEFARREKIALSEDSLARMIADNPAFQDSSGKFNADLFRRSIYEARMRESDFIEAQNAAAVRSQVTEAVAAGSILPSVFTNAMSAYSGEERKFSYITLTPDNVGKPPAPTDEQVQTWFSENEKTYEAPEYRKLEVLKVEPADIADEASVSEEDIAAEYETRKANYEVPEKRRIQQIVFKAEEAANAAQKTLAEGGLFETVLAENNLKASDVDLGLIEKSRLPAKLRDEAFSLNAGESSKVLDGPFGKTIVRVTEIQKGSVTPLTEVAADIRKNIALREASQQINGMVERVEDSRAGGASLEKTAQELGVKLRTIEAVDANARTPGGEVMSDIPESRKLLQQAFQTEVGAQSSAIDIGLTGYVWYDVAKIDPKRQRPLDEVRDLVIADWTADAQSKLLTEKAEALKARIQGGAMLVKIGEELSAPVVETKFLNRVGNDGDFTATATRAGFAGDKSNVAIVDGATAEQKMLITVSQVKRAEAEVVPVPQNQIDVANEGAADDLLSQLINNLRGNYTATQNPTAINLALTQSY